jgi:hypothetical protein
VSAFSVPLTTEEIEILLSALSAVRGEFGPLEPDEEALEKRLAVLLDPPLTPAERAVVGDVPALISPTATLRLEWEFRYLGDIYFGRPHPTFEEWRASLNATDPR